MAFKSIFAHPTRAMSIEPPDQRKRARSLVFLSKLRGGLLQSPGPAQYDWLIHFCGRPPNSKPTPSLSPNIKDQHPSVRLSNILCNGWLYGFPPHGAKQPCDYGPGVMPSPDARPHMIFTESTI
jgi:hypothetical protein